MQHHVPEEWIPQLHPHENLKISRLQFTTRWHPMPARKGYWNDRKVQQPAWT